MLQVKDLINDITYAQGENEEEIVKSWNENLKEKFGWIEDEELLEEIAEEIYDLEGIKNMINTINEAFDSQFIDAIDNNKALKWSNMTNTLVDKKYYQ
jgi:hypothetical protein